MVNSRYGPPEQNPYGQSISTEEIRSIAAYTSYGHSNFMKDEMVAYEYGATPDVLATLWKILYPHLEPTSEPRHMLWWLYNCKHYPTKYLFQKAMRVCSPTSRKHMKPFKFAFLKVRNKVIRFKDRLRYDKGRTCKVYHDGVDFKVFNKRNPMAETKPEWRQYPFDPSYNSHKFKSAGLRYGISTCIQTGEIVSCHGPFKAGKWADITIYRKHVKPMLLPGEMVEGDAGYHADSTIRGPSDFCCTSEKSAKKKVAGRHETINGRLETFRCLRNQFRHSHHEHKYYFYTAAVTTQLMLRKYGTYYVPY